MSPARTVRRRPGPSSSQTASDERSSRTIKPWRLRWGRARTGDDGAYEMDLPPEQSYMIAVVDDEWAAQSLSGIVVREGRPQSGLDLRLEKGSVIRGRVTAGPMSKPAPGQGVLLEEHGPSVPPGTLQDQPENLRTAIQHVADTDQDGRYVFRVGPGVFRLTGPYRDGLPLVTAQITVSDGQEIEQRLPPAAAGSGMADHPWSWCICGRLDGPPVAGAVVLVGPIGASITSPRCVADESGRFELPRSSGKTLVYARDPEGGFCRVRDCRR